MEFLTRNIMTVGLTLETVNTLTRTGRDRIFFGTVTMVSLPLVKSSIMGQMSSRPRKEGRILNNLRKGGVDMMDRKENNGAVRILAEHIVGENGIGYTLGEDGLYYPDLCLPEQTDYGIGKYGRMREMFLKEYEQSLYREFLLNGRLNEHLHDTEECYRMMERMKKRQGVTEQLKAEDQIMWVQKVNNVQQCAEKIVLKEVIYV